MRRSVPGQGNNYAGGEEIIFMEKARNRRYFIKGEGEASEQDSDKINAGMDAYMSGKFQQEAVEKTDKQKEDFKWLIGEVGYVAGLYGSIPYDFKPEHIHTINQDEYEKIDIVREKKLHAMYGREGVIVGEKTLEKIGELNGLILLTHELFHAFSSNKFSLNRLSEDNVSINYQHRSGVSYRYPMAANNQKKPLRQEIFLGLNEAITQEATRVFYTRIIKKSERFKDLVAEFEKDKDPEELFFPEAASYGIYGWLVRLLLDLCKKISEKRPDKFESFDGVRDEFFRIYFSGDIKGLKSLLDIVDPRCFGKLMDLKDGSDQNNIKMIKQIRKDLSLPEDPGLLHLNNDEN